MACPNCFTGHQSSDTPTGTVETIHGRPTYVAEPKEGKQAKGIIIIISDAFGWEFTNNRVLADHYADAGDYKVYLPDFMDGSAAPVWLIDSMGTMLGNASIFSKIYHGLCALKGMVPFMIKNRPGVSYPKVTSFFTAVRENEAAKLPVGAAGFCWGGLHTMKLAHGATAPNGLPLIDAGFTAHPSNLAIPADVQQITKPVAIGIGDNDFVMPMKQVEEVKKIWAGMDDKVDTEVVVYPGAGHGFAVRADHNTKDAARQAAECEQQAIAWWQKQFAKVSF